MANEPATLYCACGHPESQHPPLANYPGGRGRCEVCTSCPIFMAATAIRPTRAAPPLAYCKCGHQARQHFPPTATMPRRGSCLICPSCGDFDPLEELESERRYSRGDLVALVLAIVVVGGVLLYLGHEFSFPPVAWLAGLLVIAALSALFACWLVRHISE